MELLCPDCKIPMKVENYPMGKKIFMFEAVCEKCGLKEVKMAKAERNKEEAKADSKYIYLILEETGISGAWDDPRKAIKWYFESDFIDNDHIETMDHIYTIGEMITKMLDPRSNYPVLNKIAVNPSDGDVWIMDR